MSKELETRARELREVIGIMRYDGDLRSCDLANRIEQVAAALSQQLSAVDECKEPGRCCPACGRCYGCARPVLDCLAGIRAAPKPAGDLK